jgi:hypothetical protein
MGGQRRQLLWWQQGWRLAGCGCKGERAASVIPLAAPYSMRHVAQALGQACPGVPSVEPGVAVEMAGKSTASAA